MGEVDTRVTVASVTPLINNSVSIVTKTTHKKDPARGSVISGVQATWVLVVCHFQDGVDTPGNKYHVGGEPYHQPKDPVSRGVHIKQKAMRA